MSPTEVTNVSAHDIWLLIDDREFFLPFDRFPWFRSGSIADVLRVERPQPHHLYWPALDVDLHVDSIMHPDRFPLVAKDGSGS